MSDTEIEENDVMEENLNPIFVIKSINPETWNNIPIWIVEGVKYLSKACLETVDNLEDLRIIVNDNEKRQQNNNSTFVSQISTSENKLKRKLLDVERLNK